MPIVPVRIKKKKKKKKTDPDRKKSKTVRKAVTTKNFHPSEVTKSGKFASMSNKDVKRYRKRAGADYSNKALGKEWGNLSLARMNRASGEAARRSQKRNRRR
tara:strand:+ start:189 stop:494 length:306 start_codon:yes stop_codon:yes gene_type:complete